MAGADHATQVDPYLDEVHQQRLFLLGRQVGAEQQCRRARPRAPYSSPYCGMFSTGSSKPKKHVPTHGRSREADVLCDVRRAAVSRERSAATAACRSRAR